MTQKLEILTALKRGEKITGLGAWKKYQCYRLSDVILKLRRDGHTITTNMIPRAEGSPYAEYHYDQNTPTT